MALENEITRVAGGTKDTLKALITKLGGTVGDERIDQYPVLAGGATKPDKWDKGILFDGGTLKDVDGNDISADVKSALKLLPIPEPSDDGAFLRAQNGEWVMAQIPTAEGGTF
nr:MAG TPA: hypothetical protein [Caudoviricetes sp.]